MMIKQYLLKSLDRCKAIFTNALVGGCTAQRLTLSFCMGIYVAFSPFPGAHTIMMIILKYLFNLHFPTLFIATSINNPWTMVPFYSFDYAFGYWFLRSVIGWNPTWNISLAAFFGSGKICVWSFLIGGNILGIMIALASYPLVNRLFAQFASALARKQYP